MTDQFETSVETRELSRYVVQLRHESGRILGSGFFIAPRWILTCAHVLGDAKNVVVMPDASIATTPLPASVDVASQPPESGTSSSLWPFPDLALVHLDRHLEHPSALLCIEPPITGVEWQAWGYSEREQGVIPQGSPASFRYEGEEADGYLKLKGGEAAPGLSGSPLVCPRRRAVVGVVAAARQSHSDMGGYAVPVAPLLTGEGRLSADLIAHGSLIRAMNIPAVIRSGLTWHKVLPVHGADRVLSHPWASFVKSARTSPSDLLRAEFGVVPYLFREGLQRAIEWCDQGTPMAIARIPGDGGAGKTRFALELCKLFRERGWMVGFWRQNKDIAGVPLPRLIVVDYAEIEELRLALEMLDDLRDSASAITPVRVLLLTRTGAGGGLPESVQREAPASLASVLESNLDIDTASIALSIPEREELYRMAVQAFADAWFSAAASSIASESKRLDYPDLSSDRYSAPLEVLFEALDFVLGGEESGSGRLPMPAERVLEHERKYWRKTGPLLDQGLQESAAAMSTLAGAATYEEAHGLLTVLPALRGEAASGRREQVIAWLARLYGGPRLLNPVRPDRLGEALISRVMRAQPDGGQALLEGVLSLPSDAQVAHCLDVLAHLATTDIASQRATGAALAGCYEDLLRRIRSAADSRHLPSPIAAAYERLAEALPLPEWRHSLKEQQARVEDQVTGERAREERTKRDYSDSVAQRDHLGDFGFPQRPTFAAIPTAAESKAAHERARLSQHIEQLEGELIAVREARLAAEDELNRLRSEHADLDKLFSLKLELEKQLKIQVQHVRQEHRRREEADEQRRQAEERGDTVQRQLEIQFLRAEHEAREREKAQSALRAREHDLETQFLRAEHEAREREKAQSALRAAQRELQEGETSRQAIRSELEKSKAALQVIPELRKQLARLQGNRKKILVIAPSIGVTIGAALIGILILIIH